MPRTVDRTAGARMIDRERKPPLARQIKDTDLDFLIKFLGRAMGYPEHHFARIFRELKNRTAPDGYPKYGHVLECDGAIVGAVVQIFTTMPPGSLPAIRCHVTNWYVEPSFRPFAALFFRKALKFKDVTYISVRTRHSVKNIVGAQGFGVYSQGQFVTIPLISGLVPRGACNARVVPGDRIPDAVVEPGDYELLSDHVRFGCIALWCVFEGRAYPFVFQARRFKGFIPGVQLMYCRNVSDIIRFSRPLGLYLASRRKLLMRIDANGHIAGLAGAFIPGMEQNYCKGRAPRLGDMAYTQTVMAPFVRKVTRDSQMPSLRIPAPQKRRANAISA